MPDFWSIKILVVPERGLITSLYNQPINIKQNVRLKVFATPTAVIKQQNDAQWFLFGTSQQISLRWQR